MPASAVKNENKSDRDTVASWESVFNESQRVTRHPCLPETPAILSLVSCVLVNFNSPIVLSQLYAWRHNFSLSFLSLSTTPYRWQQVNVRRIL